MGNQKKSVTTMGSNKMSNSMMGSVMSNETTNVYCMDIKLYPRRWFLLALFMVFTSNVAVHWMQYASITNIIARYYNVPRTLVEWTSIMVMTARAFLLFPALFLIDKLETRNTLLLASTLCFIGSCIKTFTVSPDRFYIAMVGQGFSALSLVFTYSLIGRFSSAWFSSTEISTAGGLSCVGEIMGAAFGFLLPTQFVVDGTDEEIEKGLQYLHYFYTTWAFVTVVLLFIFFKSNPKRPPSAAQAHRRLNKSQRVYKSVRQLLSNPYFVMFILSQGLFVGTGGNAVGTLLNEMIDTNFTGSTSHTGNIGFLNLVGGIIGSIAFSYIQDKTRKFKCMAVTLSIAICISHIFFTLSLKMGDIIYVYISFAIYGVLMQGYYSATIQMGIELSFPVPEGIAVATTSVCVELVSMTATSIYGLALKRFGDRKTNVCVTFILVLSTIIACLVPPKFRREEIEKAAKFNVEGKELLPGSAGKMVISTSTISEVPTAEEDA